MQARHTTGHRGPGVASGINPKPKTTRADPPGVERPTALGLPQGELLQGHVTEGQSFFQAAGEPGGRAIKAGPEANLHLRLVPTGSPPRFIHQTAPLLSSSPYEQIQL